MCNNIVIEEVYTIINSKTTKNRNKIINIFNQLKEIFVGFKTDETDYEVDDKQPDITDICLFQKVKNLHNKVKVKEHKDQKINSRSDAYQITSFFSIIKSSKYS